MSTFSKALDAAQTLADNIQYVKVQCPLKYHGNKMYSMKNAITGEPVFFHLGKKTKGKNAKNATNSVGKTYMIHTIGGDSQKSAFRALDDAQFADVFNEWVYAHPIGKTFVAIIEKSTGLLLGFPQKYDIVDNISVLEFVAETPFAELMTYANLSAQQSEFYFSGSSSRFTSGLVIKNGLTGHVCLSFNSRITIGREYTYDLNDSKKVKHLSKVAEWFTEFLDAAENTFIAAVEQILYEIKGDELRLQMMDYALDLHGDDFDKFDHVVGWQFQINKISNAMEYVTMLEQHITYGQKKIFRDAIDHILDYAVQMVGSQMGLTTDIIKQYIKK